MALGQLLTKEWLRDYRVALGYWIENLRVSRSLTQRQLADHLGWSRTTLVAIEAGNQAVTVDQLLQLAAAFQSSTNAILPHVLFNVPRPPEEQDHFAIPFRKQKKPSPRA